MREDIRDWLRERAPGDVSAAIRWLEGAGFTVVRQVGGPGTMEQVAIDFSRADLVVTVMADRGVWEAAFRLPDGRVATLDALVDSRRGVEEWDFGGRVPLPRQVPEDWAQQIPASLAWLEDDPEAGTRLDRTMALRTEMLRDHLGGRYDPD